MAAQTGRTVSRFIKVQVGDSGNTLRDIPVDSIGDVGLTYEPVDLTAYQDAVKGYLSNTPGAAISITGPFDTSAAQSASGTGATPALSGSHTVLSAIAGDNLPHTVAIYFGVRHNWETGEPVFGLARSGTAAGYTLVEYTVTGDAKYKATFQPIPGSTIPGWGTAALA